MPYIVKSVTTTAHVELSADSVRGRLETDEGKTFVPESALITHTTYSAFPSGLQVEAYDRVGSVAIWDRDDPKYRPMSTLPQWLRDIVVEVIPAAARALG